MTEICICLLHGRIPDSHLMVGHGSGEPDSGLDVGRLEGGMNVIAGS